ncbi:MAG TPA: methyltransferase domain-containing protein, partial [Candidatus Omnitrophota bacterium]|nr:methyltransferase domain-containing protein [Candidatus Omnitrophota bacterium]
GKNGLEIGGPSKIFDKDEVLPLYRVVGGLDNCDFSENTVWHNAVVPDRSEMVRFNSRYICDASELATVPDGKYDFIVSSHVLEHIANPIKAMHNWMRVVKDDGYLLVVVPHKDATFDRNRPVTTVEHVFSDFNEKVGEDSLEHLPEILELHDIGRDPGAGDMENFKQRSLKNASNRCLHHHVFDTALIVSIFDRLKLQVLAVDPVFPQHIIVLGKKVRGVPDNRDFLSFRKISSPFPSDAKYRARLKKEGR